MNDKDPRHHKDPQSISGLMKPDNSRFGKLLATAREIEKLNRKLNNALEPALSGLVQVAGIRDNCLILVTPHAALATRLKLDEASIIRSFCHSEKTSIKSLKVRVAPLPQTIQTERQQRQLPEAAQESFKRYKEDSDS